MKKTHMILSVTALLAAGSLGFAETSFSTAFAAAEGYIKGGINRSIQTNAPFFHETMPGGMYLPAGKSPGFGTLRRSPTSGADGVIFVKGEGSAFAAGASWTSAFDFTFEGMPGKEHGSRAHITAVGFSTSPTSLQHTIFAAIQKTPAATDAYQLYVFTANGGFFFRNFKYALIGDNAEDDDDLTDQLHLELRLTKSATPGEFDFAASLFNRDNMETVATVTNSLTNHVAYASDLFGYFSSGSVSEMNNFDLLNVSRFKFMALP